jgi:hypothetical protein
VSDEVCLTGSAARRTRVREGAERHTGVSRLNA